MTPPTEDKKDLRREAKARLAALGEAEKAAASARMPEHLGASGFWREARSLALYCSLPDEPDTRPIFELALREGKAVTFPRMLPRAGLELCRVEDWEHGLAKNLYGIDEPKAENADLVAPRELDLVLIPGLGFDRIGTRLGRGRGDYDRLLTQLRPGCVRMGHFFAAQAFGALPAEPHDQPLTAVLTEDGVAAFV